jgi:Spore coat polysaccharide biosynthesis protein F, CMP-KDO synthetase homolog
MMTAAIIQARLGSTRLPGKILMDLAGRPVLAHVIERVRAVPGIDVVVCATTAAPGDQRVAEVAAQLGAQVFRGSEDDVLARYHGAAEAVGACRIMRVTSDNPLLDPALCGRVLALLDGGADYSCNSMPLGWPQGAGCECFTRDALDQAFVQARDPYEREHVTPWIRNNPALVKANLAGPGGTLPSNRWTLDYPEDLEFFRAMHKHLPPSHISTMDEVLAVLAAYPEISKINACRRDSGGDAR